MPEKLFSLADEADEALEALRRHYFLIHVVTQSICSLLFVTGSVLVLINDTGRVASWVYLAGSLAFATLPAIRIAHEKGHRAMSRSRKTGGGNGEGSGSDAAPRQAAQAGRRGGA
jgi:hypothetical protein